MNKKIMTPVLAVLLFCGLLPSSAQELKENTLKTAIKEATVFLSGAQITENGQFQLNKGTTLLVVSGLSPYLDANSLRVKGEGNFTVLSINTRKNYLAKTPQSEKMDSLTAALDEVENLLAETSARFDVLNEKRSLLNQNKDMSRNQNISLVQLKSAMDFFDAEVTKIKKEELALQKQQKTLKESRESLLKQITTLKSKAETPTSEAVIKVEAPERTAAAFTLTYLVKNAGWYPKYDIRLEELGKPLNLRYKAEVYQNTGIDWNNVKLTFSNGVPNQSSIRPELETWRLNYARNTIFKSLSAITNGVVSGTVYDTQGEPLPGANVIVQGTTIGTQTDFDGRFSLTLPTGATQLAVSYVGFLSQVVPLTSDEINVRLQEDINALEEVVALGYGVSDKKDSRALAGKVKGVQINEAQTPITEFREAQTTVEITVEKPYSIKSGGEKISVDLKAFEIPAEYRYVAVPKLDKDAFLMARITNWNQYSLLEGEANLYFEKGFVGRTILNANALNDTLEVSLGRDRSIVIEREKIDEFSKKRTLGANKIETRGIKIVVRNNKKNPVRLVVYDQLPVSVVSDISVTPGNLSGGQFQADIGLLEWTLNLTPGQQNALQFDYEVKYPKRERVILD